MKEAERVSSEPAKADHLCVLVHGLWGHPAHLDYLATALREKHPESRLDILIPKTNTGNFTYDGIELGAERVTKEVEDRLEELAKDGHEVKKLSIVGYSLGGLVARYVIGILYSKGWFEKLEPINFTTFATPHLGVRTPVSGIRHRIWNSLGGSLLSKSGHQLFTDDTFRSTGRPLLCLLAEPSSIFIQALSRFRHRVLYANIVNDRSAPYYTTAISSIDPFKDLSAIEINYLKGLEPLIVDADNPVSYVDLSALPGRTMYDRLKDATNMFLARAPTVALLTLFLPIGLLLFLINSGIQSYRSAQRIRLHESGRTGLGVGSYHFPLLFGTQEVQGAVDGVLGDLNHAQSQENLSDPESGPETPHSSISSSSSKQPAATSSTSQTRDPSSPEQLIAHKPTFPTMALSPSQFGMIESLNAVGFRKYPVHIHKARHSHAAIIVRKKWKSFAEGKRVIAHWLDEEFRI
ncbi:MAG: hypothetical protein M1837_006098 [Sclerophora amabilis]|nr:MAG: hypothetical protein M1837_006098 [Sclerophora amabilis]